MEHHRQPGKRRFRPGRDWLVIAAIIVGGILCGWAAGIALFYIGRWLGVDAWNQWWQISHVTSALFVAAAFVLAAAYYWLRKRRPDSDPGA